MSRRLAELLHLKPGDHVTIEPIKGERRPVEAVVSRITDSYLGMSVYADIHYLSRLVGEEFAISGMQIDLSGDERELHALYRELKQLPAVEAVNTREQLVDRLVDTVLKFQGIAIAFLIGFAGVIFFGSIVNASLVNLAERQREVATLVAMGQTHWQVGSVFFRESLVTSIAGTILGLPLGYLLMLVVAKQVENDVMRFPIVFSFWAVAATLLLALLFAVIAHGFVQWQINRMDIVEALKVKE
jgi:putative ABC transport system permease protein